MSWLHTNYASLRQCNSLFNSLCFKGDSPSSETLQALLGAAGGCPQHLEEPAQAIFLRSSHTKLSCTKSHLCCPHQSSAAPSELHSGPAAPKTRAWKSTPVAPIFVKILLKSLLFKQKQKLYVQISLSVDKHSPVLALQWVKPAPCKSRQITAHL